MIRWLVGHFTPSELDYHDEEFTHLSSTKEMSFYSIHKETFGSKMIRFMMKRSNTRNGIVQHDQMDDYTTLIEGGQEIINRYNRRIPIEMSKPESLTEFLQGSGSFLLKKGGINDTFLLNMREYEDYEVRDGFERYGGSVTLHKTRGILNILYQNKIYEPHHVEYKRVESIVKSTLFVKIAIEMHAIRLHIASAQPFAIWANNKYADDNETEVKDERDFANLIRPTTNENSMNQTHSSREEARNAQKTLLKLFTFNVLSVNSTISILLEPQALAQKLTAFTVDGYLKFAKNALKKGPFKSREIDGAKHTSWNRNIRTYKAHCETLVKSFFDRNSMGDGMNVDNLINMIVSSTLIHNILGDDLIYSMAVSGFIPPKLHIQDHNLISKKDVIMLQILLLAITTRIPLLNSLDFANIFGDKDNKYQRAWDLFVREITSSGGDVWMNIDKTEISIGY